MLGKLISDFNLQNYIRYFYPHFIDMEIEAQRR